MIQRVQLKKEGKTEGKGNSESNFQCEFCPAFYKKQGNLSAHISKFHPEKVKPDENEEIFNFSETLHQSC